MAIKEIQTPYLGTDMTCPECGLHPINLRSKHKLCVKCCYDLVRKKLRIKRQKEKGKLTKIKCLSCKKSFVPHFKGNKFCGVECQKTYAIHKKNDKWIAGSDKKYSALKRHHLHHLDSGSSGKRVNPFNRFQENR